jgi:hypothetical protein
MLNAILHKGLGATDPYQQHILTDGSNPTVKYLLISDGSKTWRLGGNVGSSSRQENPFQSKTVAEVIHNWLAKNYRYGLIDGSEPDYDAAHGGWRIATGHRTFTISKVDPNKTTAYTTALLNGKVITLSQILKSVNPSTHVFYVPVGYYYQGDMSEAPSVSGKDADDAGDRAGYNNNNNFFTPPPLTTSPKSVKSDNTMMYLMLPLLAILAVNMLGDNKRKKR